MSWVAKYRSEWTDIQALDWKVEIEEDAFAGDVTVMEATGDPLNIEFISDSDDILDTHIRGSKAELSVYSDTNFQYLDLYAVQDLQFRMSIYYGADILYWRGFILSDNHQEPYAAPPYPVTIAAMDGFGALRDILFAESVSVTSGVETITYYNDRTLESQIVLNILGKVGITSFTEYVNIYEESMVSTVTDSPFDQTKIDVDVFKDMYCYEVLEEILKKYNATIRQVAGNIIIYRPIDLDGTVKGRVFTAATTKTAATDLTPDQFIDRIGTPTDLTDSEEGTLMVRPPAKRIAINQDYGYKDSWINNYEIKENTYDSVAGCYQSWTPGLGYAHGTIPGVEKGIMIGRPVSMPGNDNVSQSFGTYALNTSDVMTFSYEYLTANYTASVISAVNYYIKIKSDNADKWLTEDTDEQYKWSNTLAYVTVAIDVPRGISGWSTVIRKMPGLPTAGTYTITLYGVDTISAACYIVYDSLKFYSTSDAIIVIKNTYGYGGFLSGFAKRFIKAPSWTIKRILDNKEVIKKTYVKTNAINGIDFQNEYILGDVADSTIDNVLEQFAGSLASVGRDTLTQTAADFITAHAGEYTTGGIVATSSTNTIIFTGQATATKLSGENFTGNTTIGNETGSLSGTVASPPTQAYISSVAQEDVIVVTGSSGTATFTIGSTTRTLTFATNIETTIDNFISSYGADYIAAEEVTLLKVSADTFVATADVAGVPFSSSKSESGLTLNISTDTANVVGQVRIDTITLTGSDGTAKIVCDNVPSPSVVNIDVDESLSYTTDWNTRGGSESKPLLEIIGDEIANQMSRPRQWLSLPIIEGDSTNTPHVNLLGNFQDILNSIYGAGENLITNPNAGDDYDTLNISGLAITSAINNAGSAVCYSDTFAVTNGEVIEVIFSLTKNSGEFPTVDIAESGAGSVSNQVVTTAGSNVITFTITSSVTAVFRFINSIAANWLTGDICVVKKPRKFVFNRGNFKVIDREWQTELIEIL